MKEIILLISSKLEEKRNEKEKKRVKDNPDKKDKEEKEEKDNVGGAKRIPSRQRNLAIRRK
jgi:hypothetical protein